MSMPWEDFSQTSGGGNPWDDFAPQQNQPEPLLNRAADMSQRAQDAVLGPLGRASDTVARGFSNLAFGSEKPAQYAEQGLGMVGKGIQKLGEGVAGDVGYVAQKLVNKFAPGVNPDIMKYADYGAAAAGTAISQIPSLLIAPEVPKSAMVEGAAQSLGRRSLGFTKGMLGRMKGGIPEANQVAQTMLDQGVIQPFSGARATLGRAEELAASSGKGVGQALATTGQNALDTNQVSQSVIDQLAPKFQGGAYDAQEKIANEIVDTIGAHGSGPIDFESAQALKNKLKDLAGANWNTDNVKAKMYQRAYGIVSDALENSVAASDVSLPIVQPGAKTGDPHGIFSYNSDLNPERQMRSMYTLNGDPEHPLMKKLAEGSSNFKTTQTMDWFKERNIPITGREPRSVQWEPLDPIPMSSASENYLQNKKLYGASQQAIKGLTDKANAEASNSLVSLRGAAIGAGALATGHVTPALEALGVWEGARRVGAGTGSAMLNYINRAPLAQGARRAALAAFIDKVVVGKQ